MKFIKVFLLILVFFISGATLAMATDGGNVVTVTILPTSGSISAPNCVISSGASACNTTFSLSIVNPQSSNSYMMKVSNPDTLVFSFLGTSGSAIRAIDYGYSTFYLLNNSVSVSGSTTTVYSSCTSGTGWNGSVCAPPVNGVCAATHYNCNAGVSAGGAESSPNWSWSCNGTNGGTNASCSEAIPPPTNHSASCSTDGRTISSSWTLPSGYSLSYFRVTDDTLGTNPPYWIPDNISDTGPSITFPATPGHAYHDWVHTRLPSGAYSNSVGVSFTCNSNLTLSVTKGGNGGGTVTSSSGGISCGANCSAPYDYGTSVTLTATPSGDSSFSSWSGGGCSSAASASPVTCVVTMDAAKTVTANFAKYAVVTSLTVSPNPSTFGQTVNLSMTSNYGYYCHILVDWDWNTNYSGYFSSGTYTSSSWPIGDHTVATICYNTDWLISGGWTAMTFTVYAPPTAPGIMTTGWTRDHFVNTNFTATTTAPSGTGSGIRGYRLCRSVDNSGGCSNWTTAGEHAGMTEVVSGSDLPSNGNFRYYYWYAFDNSGNQSTNSPGEYIRMDASAPTHNSTTVTCTTGPKIYSSGNNCYLANGATVKVNISHTDNPTVNVGTSTQYFELTKENASVGSWDGATGNIKSYANPYGISNGSLYSSYNEGLADDAHFDIQNPTCIQSGNCNDTAVGGWPVVAGSGGDSNYGVTVYMYDGLGQGVGYTSTGQWLRLDNTAPTVPTPTDAGASSNSTSLTFSASPSDSSSGIASCYAQIGDGTSNVMGTTAVGSGTSYTWTGIAGKTYYYRYYCTDNVGNSSGWSNWSDGILINNYLVSTSAGAGGSISPTSAAVGYLATTSFIITPNSNYGINSVTGCNGSLSGSTYTTGAITSACTVTATFVSLLCLSGPSGFTKCADENGTCSFSGNANVAYGCSGSYYYKGANTSTACNNTIFGDPLSGFSKACFYQTLSGTLTPAGPTCLIPNGSSSCNVTLTWGTTNPIGTSAVTASGMTQVNGNSGSQAFAVPSSRTFYLYNNSQQLASTTATSSCGGANATWNGSICIAPVISVAISASPTSMISPSSSTVLTWTTTGSPDSCTASNYWSGSKTASGGTETRTGMTDGVYTYTITCSKSGASDVTANVTVPVSAGILTTTGAASCVIPAGSGTCPISQLKYSVIGTTTTSSITADVPNPNTTVPTPTISANPIPATPPTPITPVYSYYTYTAYPGINNLYLYNNGNSLVSLPLVITAACVSGSNLSGGICTSNNATGVIHTTPNPCLISAGASTCNTTLDWSTTNPISGITSIVVRSSDSSTISKANSNAGYSTPVGYNGNTFTLSHGGKFLNAVTAQASCSQSPSRTYWDGSICHSTSTVCLENQIVNTSGVCQNCSGTDVSVNNVCSAITACTSPQIRVPATNTCANKNLCVAPQVYVPYSNLCQDKIVCTDPPIRDVYTNTCILAKDCNPPKTVKTNNTCSSSSTFIYTEN